MPTQPKTLKRRLPSEINWLRKNYNDNCFLDFFNFFLTYGKRRAKIRFQETMKFMEEDDQKSRILQNYNNWCKYKETKNYWTQREQERQKDQEDQET